MTYEDDDDREILPQVDSLEYAVEQMADARGQEKAWKDRAQFMGRQIVLLMPPDEKTYITETGTRATVTSTTTSSINGERLWDALDKRWLLFERIPEDTYEEIRFLIQNLKSVVRPAERDFRDLHRDLEDSTAYHEGAQWVRLSQVRKRIEEVSDL